jgi:predicted RNA binding protein YcfA (HicA-like mRNA interferase family)
VSRSASGSLRKLSGREVCAILGRHGFARVRQRGSHVVMQKRTEGRTLTVPVPDHRELRLGTVLSIIRQSGLARSEFEVG